MRWVNWILPLATLVVYAALIFGLSQTNGYHGQALMQGPEDEGWCERVAGGQAQ